jgi:hypothetical protein
VIILLNRIMSRFTGFGSAASLLPPEGKGAAAHPTFHFGSAFKTLEAEVTIINVHSLYA